MPSENIVEHFILKQVGYLYPTILLWALKTSDKCNQTQNDARGVCQHNGVVAFFFQKAVGNP